MTMTIEEKRVRPRINPFAEAAKQIEEDAAQEALQATEEPPVEDTRPDPEESPHAEVRASMRPTMREEDPRTRAARRAAEIRDRVGTMDEGSDDFYIDQEAIPPGWSYEWKRKTVMGMEDPAYQVQLSRMGWEPVPAQRHPAYMPGGHNYNTIERKGMILMERPLELTEEARDVEVKRARNQVRQKEAQLNSAPEGQFGRDHKEVQAKIGKSYEAIPIPRD
jgi:hypothetical protein